MPLSFSSPLRAPVLEYQAWYLRGKSWCSRSSFQNCPYVRWHGPADRKCIIRKYTSLRSISTSESTLPRDPRSSTRAFLRTLLENLNGFILRERASEDGAYFRSAISPKSPKNNKIYKAFILTIILWKSSIIRTSMQFMPKHNNKTNLKKKSTISFFFFNSLSGKSYVLQVLCR